MDQNGVAFTEFCVAYVEALIFRDHGIANGIVEKPI